jgi:LysM repeat protein
MRYQNRLAVLASVFFLFAGCIPQPVLTVTQTISPPTPVWIGTLQPYITPSPTPTQILPTSLPQIPTTPAPSQTPFIHQVTRGETMLGIAIQYGVSLEDLQAVNPDANPRLLSVGQSLVVPIKINEETGQTAATPTPYELGIGSSRCFGSDDGLACITQITNNQSVTLDSIRIGFALFNDQEEIIASEVGVTELNRLSPGESIPVYVLFGEISGIILPEDYFVRAELLTALPAKITENDRVLDLDLDDLVVNISASGSIAEVSGVIHLSAPAQQVWLIGVAYDVEDNAVGMRKWKKQIDCISELAIQTTQDSLQTPTSTPEVSTSCFFSEFSIVVYSLGPEIHSVKVFGEAIP